MRVNIKTKHILLILIFVTSLAIGLSIGFPFCFNKENKADAVEIGDTITNLNGTNCAFTVTITRRDECRLDTVTSVTGADIAIPDYVTLDNQDYYITTMGTNTFCPNTTIRNAIGSVVLPSQLTNIGISAFSLCINLENITIPNTVTVIDTNAFHECSSLKNVVLPDSVTAIRMGCFSGCSSLESLYIPKNAQLTNIATNAYFDRCRNLTNLVVDAENPYYYSNGTMLFNKAGNILYSYPSAKGDVVLPDSITRLEGYMFSGCDVITTLTIPASVSYISPQVFQSYHDVEEFIIDENNEYYSTNGDCIFNYEGTILYYWPNASGNITIPNGVITIENGAFNTNRNITGVTLSDSVVNLNGRPFSNCTNLTYLYIGAGLTTISTVALAGCNNLSNIEVSPNNQSFTSLGAILLNKTGDTLIYWLSASGDIVIPDSVVTINHSAFSQNRQITSITFGPNVAEIGNEAFLNCSSIREFIVDENNPNFIFYNGGLYSKDMTTLVFQTYDTTQPEITVPEGVITLGAFAFFGQNTRTVINLPSTLQFIQSNALAYTGLTGIVIPENVINIAGGAFIGCNHLQYVYFQNKITSPSQLSGGMFTNCPTSCIYTFIDDESLSVAMQAGTGIFTNIDFRLPVSLGVVSSPFNGGSAEINGVNAIGATVTLTAIPNSGYAFLNWVMDGEILSTENPHQFVIEDDVLVTANFVKTYDISLSTNTSQGSVTYQGNNYESETITLVATPSTSEYIFDYWVINGEIITGRKNAKYEIQNLDRDITATAYFKSAKTFVSTSIGGEVRILGNDLGTITNNTTQVAYLAVCFTGFKFVGWQVDGVIIEQSTTLKLSRYDAESKDILAVFARIGQQAETPTKLIKVNSTLGGEARLIILDTNYSTVTVIATVQQGYKFSHWEDAEGNILGYSETMQLNTDNIAQNTLTAVFISQINDDINQDLNN